MSRIADIGAAVIGTGFIGTVHVEQLRRIGVQVRGVLGSTPERGAVRADALGVPRAYASLDDILADPAVAGRPRHLAQPPPCVADARRSSLPASTSSARSRSRWTPPSSAELVALAAASGLINATNFNIRYYPLNQQPARRSRAACSATSGS